MVVMQDWSKLSKRIQGYDVTRVPFSLQSQQELQRTAFGSTQISALNYIQDFHCARPRSTGHASFCFPMPLSELFSNSSLRCNALPTLLQRNFRVVSNEYLTSNTSVAFHFVQNS